MEKTELESSLEAVLFYAGDIVPLRRLGEICDIEELSIRMAIHHLNEIYKTTNSGIEIIEGFCLKHTSILSPQPRWSYRDPTPRPPLAEQDPSRRGASALHHPYIVTH